VDEIPVRETVLSSYRTIVLYGLKQVTWSAKPSIEDQIDRQPLLSLYDCTNAHHTNPSPTSRDPVPSACCRKGKRRKDFDLTTGL
jgi:hypothetical protein